MAKGFALPPLQSFRISSLFLAGLFVLIACSKNSPTASLPAPVPEVETFPIQNTQLKNCHFKDRSPVYSYNTPIAPNPIQCDEGVAKKVELLSTSPLPNGIQFSMNDLSLVGTANEKIASAPYEFYIENEAGYQILKVQLTVR